MRGVRQIVRFNWPYYAVGTVAVMAASAAAGRVRANAGARAAMEASIALAAFWIIGSLIASWLVYDRSELMRWNWIGRVLGRLPASWINIHAGLDESTPALRALLGGARGRGLDIFDPLEMSEPSIARARKLARNEFAAEAADYRRLPVPTGAIDAALLLLSAHELRTDRARDGLFTELRRVLVPGGRVVVAEHLRDWPNSLAFGPGVLHFHSRRTWILTFERARLAVHSEFSITPFVRVFVLRS